MARTGSWMDLRFEIGCLCSYTSEMMSLWFLEESDLLFFFFLRREAHKRISDGFDLWTVRAK
ncbi:hypothetical protein ARALYDRAFT_891518 [Arabidopsis lyrata subsp. lyrata]|uniref:Uncharacterized protein n=1 Tax=Arabidopsis lyrata subsp. lyrata TaxID=81972 RepID=D7KAS4_ARALL|nr:hypothetical protein ARALYDRAFT_891518 [Arabidopsis lyrata subsp. lyrata]